MTKYAMMEKAVEENLSLIKTVEPYGVVMVRHTSRQSGQIFAKNVLIVRNTLEISRKKITRNDYFNLCTNR